MSGDPIALLLHAGDAFSAIMRRGPRFEARMTAEGWYVSAGGTFCIWSWVGLTSASPANVALLREVVTGLRARGAEGLVCYPPDLAAALAGTFRELGLGEPGVVPLMLLDTADLPPLTPSRLAVERLVDPGLLPEVVGVIAAGFEMPLDETTVAFNAALLREPAVFAYVARAPLPDDGEAVGPVVGVIAGTRFGDTVSIDIMSVDPARHRQGIGRALMLAALHDLASSAVTSVHLLSSDAGLRLYEQVGFRTVLPTLTRLIPVEPIPPEQVVV